MKTTLLAAIISSAVAITISSASAGTLDDIKAKGFVQCGVSPGLAGFSAPDASGTYQGFDVEICRAVAAAVFGDVTKIKFTPLSAKERFAALASGEVDILSRNTTWTMSRDTSQGLKFAGISYFDGQGFLVRKSIGVASALQLAGASICTETGTTTELNVADYFRGHNLKYELLAFQRVDESVQAYEAGRCDAYSNDHSSLSAQRLKLKVPNDSVILPDIISKEPLAPAVRSGDFQWSNIVRWSIYALLNAEEMGITQKNLDEMKASKNPEVRRLLGVDADLGQAMGLPPDWAYRIIKHIGNYGETFDRNVGKNSPLGIRRGLNALWKDGGVQYAPPVR